MMSIVEIGKLHEKLDDKIDVFICSASFEERCLVIAREVSTLTIPHKIIFSVMDLDNRIVQNANKLALVLGQESQIFNLAINKPALSLSNMERALSNVYSKSDPKSYLMDITTFTHEGLLMFLKLFKLRLKVNDRLILCYNSANEYSFNESERDNKWLSKGVKSVRSILGYPGLLDPSKKNHLLILFGFERQRTKQLIDIFESDIVSLAFGGKTASISNIHQELNEARHEDLIRLYPNANKLEISLIDPYDTKAQLLSYIEGIGNYNTVIAPMNNKLSTIGAGLSAMENHEIQLCYASANLYNMEGYSTPSDECYLFEVKF